MFDPSIYYTKDEIDAAEYTISKALVDLDERKLDASAYTPTDLSNYYTKSETYSKDEVDARYYTKSETYSKDEVDARDPWESGTGSDAIVKKNGNNIASGRYSQAEGHGTKATGEGAKAEGFNTEANGDYSHSDGAWTVANGSLSHTEGHQTSATSESSHAEGDSTLASGSYSHAEGYNTITNNAGEHASGKFNVSTTGLTSAVKTLFSIGNGTANDARHNAFEVRENGDIYITINGNDVLLQDYITELERITAKALTDLDSRLRALEG